MAGNMTEHMFYVRIKEKMQVINLPRKAREKHSGAIYHVMCRSISEILLFRDNEDKEYYLKLLKRYSDKYRCAVYAYCLMDNHLHIHFDPRGYDISKFMHSINTSYVLYYNKKYKRHGHVLQERFQSRILDSDGYNLAVSAYIHNNPKDIPGYLGRVEEYQYSSYGIYLGIRKDRHKLIDMGFVQGIMGTKNRKNFSRKYYGFVTSKKDVESLEQCKDACTGEEKNENIGERKVVVRELTPAKAIEYIARRFKQPVENIISDKGNKHHRELRAFAVYVLRVLCGLGYRQICETIYNITVSGCSRLCDMGFELTKEPRVEYAGIFGELLNWAVLL